MGVLVEVTEAVPLDVRRSMFDGSEDAPLDVRRSKLDAPLDVRRSMSDVTVGRCIREASEGPRVFLGRKEGLTVRKGGLLET